jgi:DNA polymerase I-like protein with 3'-5' exonuclease and polymerase domains
MTPQQGRTLLGTLPGNGGGRPNGPDNGPEPAGALAGLIDPDGPSNGGTVAPNKGNGPEPPEAPSGDGGSASPIEPPTDPGGEPARVMLLQGEDGPVLLCEINGHAWLYANDGETCLGVLWWAGGKLKVLDGTGYQLDELSKAVTDLLDGAKPDTPPVIDPPRDRPVPPGFADLVKTLGCRLGATERPVDEPPIADSQPAPAKRDAERPDRHTTPNEAFVPRTARRHNNFLRLASRYVVPAIGKPKGPRIVFDIETDGLLGAVTRVHCIVAADLDSGRVNEFGPDQIDAGLARLSEATVLVGHNIIPFDLPALRQLHGWTPAADCIVVDTLITSRLVLADIGDLDDQAAAMGDPKLGKLRGRHSLKAWGARLGIPKVGDDIEVWAEWTPEMQERCVGDVHLTKTLWAFLQPGGQPANALALEHRVASICEQITADGIPSNVAKAEALRRALAARQNVLGAELARQFPGVNLNSRQQIGKLLAQRGWVPEQLTPTGKPSINDDVLEGLPVLYPEFTGIAEYHMLAKRLGQLASGKEAWLKHIGPDGRVHGVITHIGTPHSRASHRHPNMAQVPNPKKGTPLGAECRSLFEAPDGWIFVSADQATLQDRGIAHYLTPFDGGAYGREFLSGVEQHWHRARLFGLVADGIERDKQNKAHEAAREGAKQLKYASFFGVGAEKAGRIILNAARVVERLDPNNTIGCRFAKSSQTSAVATRIGRQTLDNFEASIPGLRQLRASLHAGVRQHTWLCGLDGRRIPVRAEHKALNYIVTCSEAVICKRWLVDVYDELRAQFRYGWDGDVVLVAWIHDELVACCRPEIANLVGEIMVKHAKKAGEHYGLQLPLDASYSTGRSWAGDLIVNAPGPEAEIRAEPDVAPEAIEPAPKREPKPKPKLTPEPKLTPVPALQPKPEPGDGSRAAAIQDKYVEEHDGEPFNDQYLLSHGYVPTMEFNYILPDRTLLYQQIRYELGEGITPTKKRPRKRFLPRHQVDGAWILGAGKRRVLFNWPNIVRAGPGATILITEGEKNAVDLMEAGLLATTVLSHRWDSECVTALTGYHLIILEDHDEDGHRLAEKAKSKLAMVAASIRIVPYPHLWKRYRQINGVLSLSHTRTFPTGSERVAIPLN